MARYALRRLGGSASCVVLVVAATFAVFELLADPAAIELGPHASAEALRARRMELGLDRPALLRLGETLVRAFTLDWGVSPVAHRPVVALVRDSWLPTLAYAVPGLALASAASVTWGLHAARRRGGRLDRLGSLVATGLMSLSSVVLVLLAQWLIAHRWGLAPVTGWPVGTEDGPSLPHLVLPSVVFATLLVGPDMRHYRAVFRQQLRAPHLDGLRGRGLPETAIRRAVLRAAAGPVLARLGHRLPQALVGSVILEAAFNIPGLGSLTLDALRTSDVRLMEAIVVGTTAVTVLVQLLADLGSRVLDPRLREAS